MLLVLAAVGSHAAAESEIEHDWINVLDCGEPKTLC